MTKDTLHTIIVAGVLGTGLLGLYLLVFNMRGDLSSVDTKVTNTAERVERIAQALPDMRVRVASEEFTRPIKAAVIVANPQQTPSGAWSTAVHVFDFEKKQRTTYTAKLSADDMDSLSTAVTGKVMRIDRKAVSLAEIKAMAIGSGASKERVNPPTYLDSDASFIASDDDASDRLVEAVNLALQKMDKKPTTVNVRGDVATVPELIQELKRNPEAYRAPLLGNK
jgi:hypothetical protein